MKKIKLHDPVAAGWLVLILFSAVMMGCSKKNYPADNAGDRDQQLYNTTKNTAAEEYTPPQVITIPDDRAKSNKEGELYYENEYGYRYWRYSDGKYYLDATYEKDKAPGKRPAKKKQPHKDKPGSNAG